MTVKEMANWMGYKFEYTSEHLWEWKIIKPGVGVVYQGPKLGCYNWLKSRESEETENTEW